MKSGSSKDAIRMGKNHLELVHQRDPDIPKRLLTDVSDGANMLALELEYTSFSEIESSVYHLTNHLDRKDY